MFFCYHGFVVVHLFFAKKTLNGSAEKNIGAHQSLIWCSKSVRDNWVKKFLSSKPKVLKKSTMRVRSTCSRTPLSTFLLAWWNWSSCLSGMLLAGKNYKFCLAGLKDFIYFGEILVELKPGWPWQDWCCFGIWPKSYQSLALVLPRIANCYPG